MILKGESQKGNKIPGHLDFRLISDISLPLPWIQETISVREWLVVMKTDLQHNS